MPPRVSKKRRKTRSDQSSFCSARRRRTRDIPSINPQFKTPSGILSSYQAINQSQNPITLFALRSLGRLCGLGLPTLSTGRGRCPFVVAAGIPEAFKELEQDLSLPQSGRVGLKDTRIPSKEGYERIESTCLPIRRSDIRQTRIRESKSKEPRTGIIVSDT